VIRTKRGQRLTAKQRAELMTELRKGYVDGKSIRALAESCGRSYGTVHGYLREAGVVLRGRGGSTPGRRVGARL
jgi:transposase